MSLNWGLFLSSGTTSISSVPKYTWIQPLDSGSRQTVKTGLFLSTPMIFCKYGFCVSNTLMLLPVFSIYAKINGAMGRSIISHFFSRCVKSSAFLSWKKSFQRADKSWNRWAIFLAEVPSRRKSHVCCSRQRKGERIICDSRDAKEWILLSSDNRD